MSPGPPSRAAKITRRHFLALFGLAAGAGLTGAIVDRLIGPVAPVAAEGSTAGPATAAASPSATKPAVAASPAPRRRYRTRPDLGPPLLEVDTREPALSPGLLFLTPANGADGAGPTILDDDGELVWMRSESGRNATDLHPAIFQGRPVLTWWEGANNAGIGSGEHVIVDSTYRELARIRGAGDRKTDLHELQITPQDTALFLADADRAPAPVPGDVGPRPRVMDCAIVEVDIATGLVLFEWHAADHIATDESVATPPPTTDEIYDYIHANSIGLDNDNGLILSARNTSAVYKIDRASGRIVWRLGGVRSDFAMGPGATFALQHDARRQPDGTLTIFDDGQAPGYSRAIVLRLDETAMTATLVREYPQPQRLLATSQGNMQVLPDGHVFVGWGSLPRLSEFDPDGTLLFDAAFSAPQSYRDYRYPWVGRPTELPAIAVDGRVGAHTVYGSWNGATEVATWEVLAGRTPASLAQVAAAPRTGFETAIEVSAIGPYAAVRARDASGAILGSSVAVVMPT